MDARDLVFKTHNTEVFRLADGANATWTGDSATDTFNLLVGNLKVGNGTPDLTLSTEDAYIEGGLEVDGPVYADGGLNLSLIFNMEPVDYVLCGTQSLTPAASFYTLDPAEALTLTLAVNSANAGDMLFLTNVSTYTVTITDTNLLSSTGNALTMGQDAVAVFIFVGASWYEIALSDNS